MSFLFEKKLDREIASYTRKVERDASDLKKQGSHLIKLRMLLQERIDDKKDPSPLSQEVKLGQHVVDFMKKNPTLERPLQECTCILFYWSVVNPEFKKSVARLFHAMEHYPNNLAIQKASLAAIQNIVQANPQDCARMAPSIPILLKTLSQNPSLAASCLGILAELANDAQSQPSFVASGALGVVQKSLQQDNNPAVQANALKVLAGLSEHSSALVKSQMIPTLSKIVVGMQRNSEDKGVQKYGCWTLANLLPNTSKDQIPEITLGVVLQSMACNRKAATTTSKGLLALQVLMQKDAEYYDLFFSEGGLDLVLQAMKFHCDTIEVQVAACSILKDFTRRSLDFQRAVSAKGGIQLVLTSMTLHKEDHGLQDAAMACMRNLCLHKDNRLLVTDGIATLLQTMGLWMSEAAIQAYGCDALGRLASEPHNRLTITKINGIQIILKAMQAHPNHPGVQDRACFLLLALTDDSQALTVLKSKNTMGLLAACKLPPKPGAQERLDLLKKRVSQKSGWFGRRGEKAAAE